MRADCHIHLDKIGGPHITEPPTLDLYKAYALREAITVFFAIYEYDETLFRFQTAGTDLVPIYWERNPLNPSIPVSAKGIKLHPYIEKYELTRRNVEPALEEARARGLFVFIHTEDREPDLSRGTLVAELASTYKDVVFVMAHSGSYAPPRTDDPDTIFIKDSLVHELVSEAVEVARKHSNVYLETSILASDEKASILARAPLSKLLIGTDFPISAGDYRSSLSFQEKQLARFGLNEFDLEQIHRNAAFFQGQELAPRQVSETYT